MPYVTHLAQDHVHTNEPARRAGEHRGDHAVAEERVVPRSVSQCINRLPREEFKRLDVGRAVVNVTVMQVGPVIGREIHVMRRPS